MLNWTDYDCTHSFPNVLSCYFQQISRPLRSFWNHIDLLNVIWYIAYLYYNTVLVVSVILFVGYRNHLTVVQFKNQAHIWNPHGTGQVFKTIWVAACAPKFYIFFYYRRRRRWILPPPFLFLLSPPKAAVSQIGARGASKAAPKAPLSRRAREILPEACVSRVS